MATGFGSTGAVAATVGAGVAVVDVLAGVAFSTGADATGALAATFAGAGVGVGAAFAAGPDSFPAIAGSGGAADFAAIGFGSAAGRVFSAAGSGDLSADDFAAGEIEIETTWSFCTMAKPKLV